MLTVRHAQLAALGRDVGQRFVDDLTQRFSALYPAAQNLGPRIVACQARALGYAITENDDVHWFVQLDLRLGPEWELAPAMRWALDILDSPAVDIAGRRYRLEKGLQRRTPHAE